MFEEAGWKVVDRDFYSPTLTAAAIREGLLEGNREADYFLFINGMAVGILEAKRMEVDVTSHSVCEQAADYARYRKIKQTFCFRLFFPYLIIFSLHK